MTPKTPETASSSPANLLPAVAVLALSVIAIVLAMAVSASASAGAARVTRDYDNPSSRKMLSAPAPGPLTIIAPQQETTVKKEATASWKSTAVENLQARTHSSLLQYFYEQTGTAHPWSAYDYRAQIKGAAWSEHALGQWLQAQARLTNQQAQDAALVIENEKAVSFTAHQDGRTLDLPQALLGLKRALLSQAAEYALPLKINLPKVRLGDLNNLGIKERLARGQSDFTGSTASRIVNIGVGAAQFRGVIIKPGEEFSFNQYLGSITEAKGYLPELVIKSEGTTKELGGGLCQVATTAFRAAFFSGLPITARRNHSYAVHYYEWIADDKPLSVGLDATIYPGAQDMKFINDTPGHILIWTHSEDKRLYFDFYGAPDDRQIAMDGPYAFDRKPSGAVKAKVTRTVTKNGTAQEAIFNSNYVSPNLYPKLYELPKNPPAPAESSGPPNPPPAGGPAPATPPSATN